MLGLMQLLSHGNLFSGVPTSHPHSFCANINASESLELFSKRIIKAFTHYAKLKKHMYVLVNNRLIVLTFAFCSLLNLYFVLLTVTLQYKYKII